MNHPNLADLVMCITLDIVNTNLNNNNNYIDQQKVNRPNALLDAAQLLMKLKNKNTCMSVGRKTKEKSMTMKILILNEEVHVIQLSIIT